MNAPDDEGQFAVHGGVLHRVNRIFDQSDEVYDSSTSAEYSHGFEWSTCLRAMWLCFVCLESCSTSPLSILILNSDAEKMNTHVRPMNVRPMDFEYEKRDLIRKLDKDRSLCDLRGFSKIDFDFYNDGLDR